MTKFSNNISETQARSSGSMPSNTMINPKSLNAITLRSGKKVDFNEELGDDEVDEEIVVESPSTSSEPKITPKEASIKFESAKEKNLLKKSLKPPIVKEESQMKDNKKDQHNHASSSKGSELFSKLEVNMPMLDLIKKMPKCDKILKDICTNKRKYKHSKRIQLGSSVSALFKPQLPIKCKDFGAHTIPCTIGKLTITYALLDLGATINVMPTFVHKKLGIKSLKDTGVVLGLADRSVRYPQGILEDVLVEVKCFVFLADFYILDMTNEMHTNSTLILERPFDRTGISPSRLSRM
ncbi:uncharacterized protein LOC114757251 [Neltuma alba]|uniref:uncharacterized protein LOC114757251 n=1 Tax=Neltuma alba TaxID=207710 RepID=UPI0010A4A566|nr:uncharacterized protein LOC114757251 [Prosopis alba]